MSVAISPSSVLCSGRCRLVLTAVLCLGVGILAAPAGGGGLPEPGSQAGLALAVGASLALARDVPSMLAAAMVSAPNAQVSIDPATDPSAEALAQAGVSEQRRVEVGPPPASLLVWIVRPPPEAAAPPRGTILLLHGICSSRREHLRLARHLAARGYIAVLPDLRGQGRSSGQWLTYGWQEARDLQQLIDRLLAADTVVPPLGVLGASYGAAAASQFAAIEPRLSAVVSIASYTAMAEVVPHYVREFAPFLQALVSEGQVDAAVDAAGRLAGFDPAAAAPLEAVRRHRTPTLFLHGEKDADIPVEHARRLSAAAAGPSRLALVPGGSHHCGGSAFVRDQATAWFERWLSPETPAAGPP